MTLMPENSVKELVEKKAEKAELVVQKGEAASEQQNVGVATVAGVEEKKEVKKAAPRRVTKKITSVSVSEQLLFGKYNMKEVVINDPSLVNYITLNAKAYPNTFGRRKNRVYTASHVNIVERLINKLMRGGTGQKIGGKVIRTEGALQGKKIKVMHIVEDAFDIIHKQTGKNPVQLLVNALEFAAPIEDTTRIRYGGINYNVAMGIGAARRLDVALRNVALASLISAFKSRKRLAQALADEIILASNKDTNSYAVKKKVELERIARSAR